MFKGPTLDKDESSGEQPVVIGDDENQRPINHQDDGTWTQGLGVLVMLLVNPPGESVIAILIYGVLLYSLKGTAATTLLQSPQIFSVEYSK